MGRLIDADKLKAHYAWWEGGTRETTMDEAKRDFDTIIDVQPTVTVANSEPVRHGRWVISFDFFKNGKEHYKCSRCGYLQVANEFSDDYHYCPNCGAKMDGEREDAN